MGWSSLLDSLYSFLSSSLLWNIIALVLAAIAFSGRVSVSVANFLLLMAWILSIVGIARWVSALSLPWVPHVLFLVLCASGLGLGMYYLADWYTIIPKHSSADNLQTQDDTKARLDEIKHLLMNQADAISPQKLLAKYPLGYVIFELDYKNEVFPYASQSILDKYELDWSVVRFTVNTVTRVEIRLPDFKLKDGGAFADVRTGGPKRVGNLGGASIGELMILGEILAIRDKGIVFLVGLVRMPDFPKR